MRMEADMRYGGIDLLKTLAMFSVVVLHLLGRGGVLYAAQGSHRAIGWLLEVLCFGAANVYALISGFLGFGKKHRLSKYLLTWLQVVFYGLITSVAACCLKGAGWRDVLHALFPVAFSQYWYFTAYTGTFLLMPLLDQLIERTKREWLPQVIVGLLLFSCYVTLTSQSDPFVLRAGYSFVWLSILYFIGGIVRKYDLHTRIRRRSAILVLVCLVAVAYLWMMLTDSMYPFVSYTSPTVLGCAVCLLLLFASVKSDPPPLVSWAASTFGVYLLHEAPVVKTSLIQARFLFVADLHPLWMIPTILFLALTIFTIGILVDKFRMRIFERCRATELAEKAEALLKGLIQRVVAFIRF